MNPAAILYNLNRKEPKKGKLSNEEIVVCYLLLNVFLEITIQSLADIMGMTLENAELFIDYYEDLLIETYDIDPEFAAQLDPYEFQNTSVLAQDIIYYHHTAIPRLVEQYYEYLIDMCI